MIFLAALLVFVLDRLTKIAAMSNMSYGQSIEVLPKVFHITFIRNDGTAFGLLKGQNTFLALLSVIAIIGILIYAVTHKRIGRGISVALGLVLGGALGNLFDRIRFGCVIDFFDFRVWPVFNVADSAITIGVILLSWHILTNNVNVKE
ncbi:MAG: signal peptidase II [Candidatus Omnitrophica bacterium]|nr:signal peptidase II [Candidatus Omnitrophota bacterium]